MRIGIDCRLWNETGVGRYIRNLIKHLQILDEKNKYVLFVKNEDFDNVQSQLSNLNFQLVKTNIRWHSVEEQITFPKILNKEKLDLMHFPYFSVPVFYKKPFVVTIHDLILHNFPTGEASTLPLPLFKAKLFGYKFVVSQAAKRARKIIVPSFAVKEELLKRLKISEQKIEVTHCGVDENVSSKFKVQSSNKYKITNIENNKYFLYVGNAYPHKNLKTLIEAFRLFKLENKNDVKLLLAGREDYFYKRIKDELKEKNELDVQLLTPKEDSLLAYLYQNAIALIVPSFMEGFGLTALEAMSNKCLVIVSDIPVLKEVCDNVPIYFNPNSPDDLKEKMVDVYKNSKKYKKNIEQGIDQIKKFSWGEMAKETLKIYETSLKK